MRTLARGLAVAIAFFVAPIAHAEPQATAPSPKQETDAKAPSKATPIHVHISADAKDVSLVRTRSFDDYAKYGPPWRTRVCQAPCDQLVDPTGNFTIVSESAFSGSSNEFSLADQVGKTTLLVEAGTPAAMWTSVIFTSVALLSGLTAVGLLGGSLESRGGTKDDLEIAGVVAASIGLTTGAVGLIALPFTVSDVDIIGERRERHARAPQYWRGEF